LARPKSTNIACTEIRENLRKPVGTIAVLLQLVGLHGEKMTRRKAFA
jgi:hypothetical protein